MNEATSPDCFQAITGLDGALRPILENGTSYYVLGGIATAALLDERTVIDPKNEEVRTSALLTMESMRPNGTKRDVDILVGQVLDNETVKKLKAAVEGAVGDTLVVSIFGLDAYEPQSSRFKRLARGAGAWVSQRTIDRSGTIRHELFPLSQPVKPESYTPWTLHLPNGAKVSILHPVGHCLAYRGRSIGGPRPKDNEKRIAMEKRVRAVFPSMLLEKDELFYEWGKFADDIVRLGTGSALDGLHQSAAVTDVMAARMRARILRWLEERPMAVNFAQGIGERILKPLVGNK